jgi:HK97 family phage prohead protease
MPDPGSLVLRRPRTNGFYSAEATLVRDPGDRDVRSFSFVASTNSVDRYGDIIEQDWDLKDFWPNPVLLWAHNSREPPIGKVTSFEVSADKTKSIAKAELRPAGDNAFVDDLAKLLDMGLLNAVSVGFLPGKEDARMDERGRWVGSIYTANKLVELSLVSIPANAEAIQLARGNGLGPAEIERIFKPREPQPPSPTFDQRRLAAELDVFSVKNRRRP